MLLLLLGGIMNIFMSKIIIKYYLQPEYRMSLICVIAGGMIFPAALLAYIRKAIAQKHGDWKILVFVLSFNLLLLLLID